MTELERLREALTAVSEITMLGCSDPHAQADWYRSRLSKACNVALAALDAALHATPAATAAKEMQRECDCAEGVEGDGHDPSCASRLPLPEAAAPPTLERDLASVLNRYSQENASNTPDFILAQFLLAALAAWNTGVQQRETWYGRDARPTATTIITGASK